MKRFLGILLVALSIGLLGSLFGQSYASAVSNWDNTIQNTNELKLNGYAFDSCDELDITDIYNDLVFDIDNWHSGITGVHAEYTDALSNAISNGSYVIMNRKGLYPPHTVEIFYSVSGLSLNWTTNGSDNVVYANDVLGNDIRAITLNVSSSLNDCEGGVENAGLTSNNVLIGTDQADSEYYIFDHSSNFEYNYPDGYEGALMPVNRPGVDNVPDWYVPSAVDWKVSISDMNFFTTDMKYPFLCEEDLVPSIITEIINDDDVVVDEQTYGAGSQIWFQAEKLDTEQKFTVRGKYYCGDNDALQFTHWGSREFTIGENGHLKENMFSNCMVLEAFTNPEFDYMACLNNIYIFANMLSFDTVRFANSWVSQGNCTTLGTLGDWLNLSNKTVCPYFSNEVRAVITPFITFLLGLLTVKFIAGKGSHGSMRESV